MSADCLSRVVEDAVWQAGLELQMFELQKFKRIPNGKRPAASMVAMQLALTDADFELAE
eukprot:m.195832 g.195832  ORF g.195832 m.195832 type:complete len:59 (-) comp53732_c1_seq1:127-303(-)